MINLTPDWDTDCVVLVLPTALMNYYNDSLAELELFYADFLVEIAKHDTVICLVPNKGHVEKMVRLTRLDTSIFCIAEVEDIWVRDFAPIQSEQCYIKFIFNPAYESKLNNEFIDKSFINYFFANQIKDCFADMMFIDICLEGGNFIHNREGKVIVTEKIYSQNRNKTKDEIDRLLRDKLFIEKLVVVPTEPGDRTGHTDGMLRWIDANRIVINGYQADEPRRAKFLKKLNNCLDKYLPDVERITIPYFPSAEQTKGWFSAEGNYINFLRTRNRVYVPVYNTLEEAAIQEIYSQIFGEKVSFIEANVLAKYGGALNCITWNYKLSH